MAYFRPETKEEALKLLNEKHPKIIAGGTDLVVKMHKMMFEFDNILDISLLPLNHITYNKNQKTIQIGTLATMSEIMKNPLVQQGFPLLAKAVSSIGAPQIRNRATLGGNISNSSPAADGAAALSALNAKLKIESIDGSREVPISDFFVGPGKNILAPNEMLTEIILEYNLNNKVICHWYKAGNRKAQVISMVAFAGQTIFDSQNKIMDISLALASVAPVTLRLFKTENFLKGKELTPQTMEKALKIADTEVNPISDVRASKEYRKHLAQVFLKRHLIQDKENLLIPKEISISVQEEFPVKTSIDQQHLYINGAKIKYNGSKDKRLLDVLREDFGFTGTKNGCGEGECGACTVLLNDIPVNSCLVLVGNALGKNITTVEGLSENGKPGTIQQAFIDAGAIQCGFCTPGFEVTAHALLQNHKNLSKEEIKSELEGNLCRCTGYVKIIEAVELAFKRKGENQK